MFVYLKTILCYVLGVGKNIQTRLQKYTAYYFDYSYSEYFHRSEILQRCLKNKRGTYIFFSPRALKPKFYLHVC